MRRVIFLDRDGVVNEAIKLENGKLGSPHNLGAFVFREEIFEFVRIAGDRAFDIVIFTNQPEVARGNFELTDMQKLKNIAERNYRCWIISPVTMMKATHANAANQNRECLSKP